MRNEGEIERSAREVGCPQLFNMAFGGLTPHVSRSWLRELGYELVLFADVASVVHHSLAAFHARLAEADTLDDLGDAVTGFEAFNAFVGLPEWRALEQRYAGD